MTAILTVASKDEPTWQRAHEACSRHMESLLSPLIYGGVTTVGSVEALLILAEWAPQPPHELSIIGCGKEDYGAWMLVGVAIRLGYLQRLEQTGLQAPGDSPSESYNRGKIAWAGKGFPWDATMANEANMVCSMLYERPTSIYPSWEGVLVPWSRCSVRLTGRRFSFAALSASWTR